MSTERYDGMMSYLNQHKLTINQHRVLQMMIAMFQSLPDNAVPDAYACGGEYTFAWENGESYFSIDLDDTGYLHCFYRHRGTGESQCWDYKETP